MYLFWVIVCGAVICSPSYFILATTTFISMYPPIHLVLYKQLWYKRLCFNDKMTVVSKRIKSVVVLCLLPCMVYGWDNEVIVWCGIAYAAAHTANLCMVSMGYVRKMYHLLMLVFVGLSPYIDFEEDSPARCAVVYCWFSCLMCWVDFGSTYINTFRMRVCICTCSWLWQVFYMATHDMSFFGVLWVSCLVILVNNDIVGFKG